MGQTTGRITAIIAIAAALGIGVSGGSGSAETGLSPVTPSINPELAEHTRHFEKKIYKIADNVYSAVGWHLANTVVVEGEDGLIVIDTGEAYGLEIRRAVCQFHETVPPAADVTLVLHTGVLQRILLQQTTWGGAIADGSIQVEGDQEVIGTFFGYFDGPPAEAIRLTLR